jgi:CheY-like chemotaxis protein
MDANKKKGWGMSRFKDKQILIVDDEPAILEILSEEFDREGAKTFRASQAFEAFVVLTTNAIDLVITDIRMAGGDGTTLLDKMRQADVAYPPIIFITGYSDLSIQDAYKLGAQGVVAKPFETETLLDRALQFLISKAMRYQEKNEHPAAVRIEKEFESVRGAAEHGKFFLGRGGFFLEGNHGVKTNEVIQFKISFGSERLNLLEGEGIVRWTRYMSAEKGPVGAGVEITFLTEECRLTVCQYLDSLKTSIYIPNGIN